MEKVHNCKQAVSACTNNDYLVGYASALSGVEGQLAAEPAIDAEPVRHGRWIRTETRRGKEIHTLYVCSECNDYHGFRDDPGAASFAGNYLFCRICGARMDMEVKNNA